MTTRPLPHATPFGETSRARRLTAGLLRCACVALARVARRLHRPERVHTTEPVLEFYAEAGAPEGALYFDGQLVGFVPGVKRL